MSRARSKRWRSLVKATSWETIAFFITGTLAYWYTGDFNLSAEFSLVCLFVKIIGLYLHERLWHHIDYGKLTHEDQVFLRPATGSPHSVGYVTPQNIPKFSFDKWHLYAILTV